MRLLAFTTLLLAPLPALAQTTPVAPIQKGTALPPPGTDEAAVLAPITALFTALRTQDSAAILQQTHGPGGITAVTTRADGTPVVRQASWADWAATLKPGSGLLEERLLMPAIEIDGDMAMVWSDYVFHIDGKFSHCGTDHFSLVRVSGQWKIANLAWTQRTTNCPGQ